MMSKRPSHALQRRLRRYQGEALWTLIGAAGASPRVRHRWPTLGHLAAVTLSSDPAGDHVAEPRDLLELLEACSADEPRLARMEDFVPKDPREEVLIRVDEAVLRLFPGAVERPVADVRRAMLVAQATDPALTSRLGFGVRDLVTAALTCADRAITLMASAWPTSEFPGRAPAAVTTAELEAGGQLGAVLAAAAESLPEAQQRALAWMTTTATDLPYQPDHPQSTFGRFLRVTAPDSQAPPRWMPLSHIPEILGRAVTELVSLVATEPGLRRSFTQGAAADARRALWRFSSTVLGPPEVEGTPGVGRGDSVQWVAMLGPARAVLVQLVEQLETVDQARQLEAAPAVLQVVQHARAHPGQDITIPMPGGSMRLDPNVEVVPLLVVAAAGHIAVPQSPGLPAMSLDDLLWAATSATDDSDLFLFCRDLARPDRPSFFGWEAINVWEWWLSNGKTLFAGGLAPTGMFLAPHAGDAEWDRACSLAPLERALAPLGLPGLDDVDGVEHEHTGPPSIYQFIDPGTGQPGPDRTAQMPAGMYRRGDLLGWTIHIADVPVAVLAAHPTWPAQAYDLLHDLAAAFAFGLRGIQPAWQEAHAGRPVTGYLWELEASSSSEAPMLQVAPHAAPSAASASMPSAAGITRVVIEVNSEALAQRGDADVTSVRAAMAAVVQTSLLAAGLPTHEAEKVAAAWEAAPATLAVRLMDSPTTRHDLPAPQQLQPALTSQVDRLVAGAVRQAGVSPGTYTGDAAKELDRDVLAPASLQVLTDRLHDYAMDDLVWRGMVEIERALAQRDQQVLDLERSASLQVDWDPVQRHIELQREHLTLRHCSEVVVEAALRTQPHGSRRVDQISWAEISAAAYAYLSATTRSEQVHHQVRPSALTINSTFEIRVIDDTDQRRTLAGAGRGATYDLNMGALQQAQSAQQMDDRSSTGRGQRSMAEQEANEVRHPPAPSQPDRPPSLIDPDLDAALVESFGASGSDILTTLFALARWPLTAADDDVVAVDVLVVVDHVVEMTILGQMPDGRTRIERAVALLTSTSSALAASQWKPWHARSRRHRLLIQPLAKLLDGRVVIAPHFCLGALSAYRAHLSQGQLPWTQPALGEAPLAKSVTDALAAVRDRRNRALEAEVADRLRGWGWQVVSKVKPADPQRLNVPSLAGGEIDIVAGSSGQSTIWLLEVKDPADTYAVPEVRRHLDTFLTDRGSKPCYATQLQRKVQDLLPHLDAVAEALGLPSRGGGYALRAAFVTRKPVPAAFVTSSFLFASLEELHELLGVQEIQQRSVKGL